MGWRREECGSDPAQLRYDCCESSALPDDGRRNEPKRKGEGVLPRSGCAMTSCVLLVRCGWLGFASDKCVQSIVYSTVVIPSWGNGYIYGVRTCRLKDPAYRFAYIRGWGGSRRWNRVQLDHQESLGSPLLFNRSQYYSHHHEAPSTRCR